MPANNSYQTTYVDAVPFVRVACAIGTNYASGQHPQIAPPWEGIRMSRRRFENPNLKLLTRYLRDCCGICGMAGVRPGDVTCGRCHQRAQRIHQDDAIGQDDSEHVRRTGRGTGDARGLK